MTAFAWILVAVLTCIVVWLLLALSGASRTIAALRQAGSEPVDGTQMRHLSSGLAAGRPAPGLGALDDEHRGVRHLVVFVDPDCAACDSLVPALQRLARDRRLPRTILVSRGDPAEAPAPWRAASERIRWMTESGTVLSDAYEVDVTPTAFVVDEGGLIVAGGPTATIEDVVTLTDGTDGVRVAPGTSPQASEASRATP